MMYQQPTVRQNRLPTPPNAGLSSPTTLGEDQNTHSGVEHSTHSSNPESTNNTANENTNDEATPPSPRSKAEDLEPKIEMKDRTSHATGESGEGQDRMDHNDAQPNSNSIADVIADATAEAIASAKAATAGISTGISAPSSEANDNNEISDKAKFTDNEEKEPTLNDEHSKRLLSQLAEMKPDEAAALKSNGANGETPRVSLALLLEASAAAAEAEQKAEKQRVDPELLRRCAQERAETDKYITEAIHRVQTTPRNERAVELRPVDRREREVEANWSRYEQIKNDSRLLGECRRLVRGTQGCGRECDAKFTNLVDFAKHVDEMHDINFRPFLCPKDQCPWAIIGFHERSECTRHIRTKHYKAMYSCEFQGCTKVYNRSDAFRRHVRQAHANPGSRFNRLTQRSDDGK